jgi:hypothetical protein
MKKLRVTLEIDVKALDGDELENALTGLDDDAREAFDVDTALEEVSAEELGDTIRDMFSEARVQEAFAGSNLFVTFDCETVDVTDAEFVEA